MSQSSRILPIDTDALLQKTRDFPDTPGIYYFLNDKEYPIYIGKSIHLKQRVQSHLYAANRDVKENKIAHGTVDIRYEETAGELGALIHESVEVKRYLPLFNRQLRRKSKLVTWVLNTKHEYHSVDLVDAAWPPDVGVQYFGLYASPFKAKRHLERLAGQYGLCKKRLGLESAAGACFAYQLKKCQGACIDREPVHDHNTRLDEAMQQNKVNDWPFSGPVGIVEAKAESAYLFDQWHYLGSFPKTDLMTIDDISELIGSYDEKHTLDRDSYQILINRLRNDKSLEILSF